jgi:hypothetical protein
MVVILIRRAGQRRRRNPAGEGAGIPGAAKTGFRLKKSDFWSGPSRITLFLAYLPT